MIEFNEDGVKLEVDDVQVKPIWDDKVLKYRQFNADDKESLKSQVELSLEEQIRILKKQFQELYLL